MSVSLRADCSSESQGKVTATKLLPTKKNCNLTEHDT